MNPLVPLFDAYLKATGFQFALSRSRETDLREIHRRGITPLDIEQAISHLQLRIKRGDNGCTRASLLWQNAMAPDRLEGHLMLARSAKPAKKEIRVTNRPEIPLQKPSAEEADTIRAAAKESFNALRQKLAGPSANPEARP